MLRVADHALPVRTLGPGARLVLWTQGCDRCCAGCTSPEWRPLHGGSTWPVPLLVHDILRRLAECPVPIEGITLSGGEPMLQAEALLDFWTRLRAHRADLSLILFTGREEGELASLPGAARLAKEADILVVGPYVAALDDGVGLRGSSNQQVIVRSGRYEALSGALDVQERKMQAFERPWGTLFAGIPPRGFRQRLDAGFGEAVVR